MRVGPVGARKDQQTKSKTRLARLRVERGITQAALAEAIGVSLPTYQRLESGQTKNPPFGYLVNCAIALNVALESVLEPNQLRWTGFTTASSRPPSPRGLWQPWRPGADAKFVRETLAERRRT